MSAKPKSKLATVVASYFDNEGEYCRRRALTRFYCRLAKTFSQHGQLDPETRTLPINKTTYAINKYYNDNKDENNPGTSKGRVIDYVAVYVRLGLAELEWDGKVTLIIPRAKKEQGEAGRQLSAAIIQPAPVLAVIGD